MAHENYDDLLDMAPVFALDAVTPAERDQIEAQLAEAETEIAERFAAEVRDIHETLAVMSAATATEPPPALRERLLAEIAEDASTGHTEPAPEPEADAPAPPPVSLDERRRQSQRRNFLLAAAAAVVIAVGGIIVAGQWTSTPDRPASERVFAAEDVRTSSGQLDGGGTVTVVFSQSEEAGVLVMNNVAPPAEGTVYQMWLLGPEGAQPAGTMTPEDVAPSTTAVLEEISGATALGFSVEPAGGSTQPTAIFAQLPLE